MQVKKIMKHSVQKVWMGWEQVFELFSRLRSKYAGEFGICKMFVTQYRGIAAKACNARMGRGFKTEIGLESYIWIIARSSLCCNPMRRTESP